MEGMGLRSLTALLQSLMSFLELAEVAFSLLPLTEAVVQAVLLFPVLTPLNRTLELLLAQLLLVSLLLLNIQGAQGELALAGS